jgi:hypothetical protein
MNIQEKIDNIQMENLASYLRMQGASLLEEYKHSKKQEFLECADTPEEGEDDYRDWLCTLDKVLSKVLTNDCYAIDLRYWEMVEEKQLFPQDIVEYFNANDGEEVLMPVEYSCSEQELAALQEAAHWTKDTIQVEIAGQILGNLPELQPDLMENPPANSGWDSW